MHFLKLAMTYLINTAQLWEHPCLKNECFWGVTTDPGSIPACVTTGRDREYHRTVYNWPGVIRVRGLAGGALLGSLRSSDSLWRAGRLQADGGSQLNCVSSDTLVQLASRLRGRLLRSAVWRVMFRRTLDSLRFSRARWGVAAMRQDCSGIAFGYHEIGRKRG